MADAGYDGFIEDCRLQRAALIGLIEALEGKTLIPGQRIATPENLQAPTDAVRTSFEQALTALQTLITAYEAGAGT